MTTTMSCGEPVDLQHITGQEHVRRALEVAAAGGHHLLLMGAPGAGKTTLARAFWRENSRTAALGHFKPCIGAW